jgi:hypothetical protein
MTTTHIPATLDFKPVRGSMAHFTAEVDENEFFSIHFAPEHPQGYQWRLSIWGRKRAVQVFLGGHFDRDEAEQAARIHLGMD